VHKRVVCPLDDDDELTSVRLPSPGCLKDLKRFWRMDEKDDDRTVARIFHEVGVLKKDLIPILKMTLGTGAKGDRIALACGACTTPFLSAFTR